GQRRRARELQQRRTNVDEANKVLDSLRPALASLAGRQLDREQDAVLLVPQAGAMRWGGAGQSRPVGEEALAVIGEDADQGLVIEARPFERFEQDSQLMVRLSEQLVIESLRALPAAPRRRAARGDGGKVHPNSPLERLAWIHEAAIERVN